MSEKTEIMSLVEQYLFSKGVKFIHLENNQRQQKRRASKYKKYKGCVDHIIPMGQGKTLYMEYKLEYNDLSSDQKDWKKYLEDKDHFVYTVRSFEEAKQVLDFFMEETL